MCDKFDVPAQRKFKITYLDAGDDKITIMEQDDLDVAYAIAIGGSMKLKFFIELSSNKVFQSQTMAASLMNNDVLAQSMLFTEVPIKNDAPISMGTDPMDEGLLEENKEQLNAADEGCIGKKIKSGGKKNGMPRKALKSLIQ